LRTCQVQGCEDTSDSISFTGGTVVVAMLVVMVIEVVLVLEVVMVCDRKRNADNALYN